METIDVIQAWQVEKGDLIQFEAYDGEERYVELLRVESIVKEGVIPEGIYVGGESLITGGKEWHLLDYYLEVEVMGA